MRGITQRSPTHLAWLGAALVLGAAAGVQGQGAEYLWPDAFQARVGDTVTLSVQREDAGAGPGMLRAGSWPERFEWFFIRVAGIQDNRTAVATVGGPDAPAAAAVALETPGVTMFALDWEPEVLTMDGQALARLVASRTTAKERPRVDRPVRVRHIRSAKALVRVRAMGAQPPDAATAVSKSGQAVEIRPIFDPTVAMVGSDVGIRLYAGDSIAGAKATAVHVPTGRVQEVSTNDKGIGNIRITGPGAWRVRFQHAAPVAGDPEADWVLHTATLTFEAPAGGEGGR